MKQNRRQKIIATDPHNGQVDDSDDRTDRNIISMHNAIPYLLDHESIDLPKSPAVFALFTNDHCYLVDITANLHDTIVNHLKCLSSPDQFRISDCDGHDKILLYQLFKYEANVKWLEIKLQWTELFSPVSYSGTGMAL